MIRLIFYKGYCIVHKYAKVLLGRYKLRDRFRMVDVDESDFSYCRHVSMYLGDKDQKGALIASFLKKEEVYPVENIVPIASNTHLKTSFTRPKSKSPKYGVVVADSSHYWEFFIRHSSIPKGYKNQGMNYAGYIGGRNGGWCLPSWIWTNAALVRYYCFSGDYEEARRIAGLLENLQMPCGGWVVRDDYSNMGPTPIVAPNDSAYIANNAFLELYKKTMDKKYLDIAVNCADWIISVARPDGLVFTGYNATSGEWLTKHIIVDIGFTAALFANIYEITNEKRYKIFLDKFIDRYISLFYIENDSGFTTSIDSNNRPVGGMFARGQAWALEGLIPAYKISKSAALAKVIDNTVKTIISNQLPNGGWSYNFKKPMLGEDCKGVPIIAKSLLDWNDYFPSDEIIRAGFGALNWCREHTQIDGDGKGGIFSFNMEGAVVHNLYTATAFVYSSAYAIELEGSMRKYEHDYCY